MMKKLLLLLILSVSPLLTMANQQLDRIVAVVGDDVISKTQLDQAVLAVRNRMESMQQPIPSEPALQRQVLSHMVNKTIELQYADRLGIQVDDFMIDDAVKSMAAKNNLTIEQFKREASLEMGSMQAFRDEIREQMILGKLHRREVGPKVNVSARELDDFLASPQGQDQSGMEYKLQHILLTLPQEPSPEQIQQTKAKAQALLDEINGGTAFSTIAARASNGDSAFSGGDLGWRKVPELPTIFADKVLQLTKGDVAGPIRSPSGFHIIKLADKRQQQNLHQVEQSHVRHILIKTAPGIKNQLVPEKILTIEEQLKSGATFASLAEQYSDDPISRLKVVI